jgi:uncharacterized protein YhaN
MQELALSRKAAQDQLTHIETEAKKADIYRTIQILETRLERLYREPIYFVSDGVLRKWELYFLLSHGKPEVLKVIPPLVDTPPPQYYAEFSQTKATLTQLHVTLVKLSFLLTSLAPLDENDAFVLFYEPTLTHLANKLKEVGYLPSPDDETINQQRELRQMLRENRRRAS